MVPSPRTFEHGEGELEVGEIRVDRDIWTDEIDCEEEENWPMEEFSLFRFFTTIVTSNPHPKGAPGLQKKHGVGFFS